MKTLHNALILSFLSLIGLLTGNAPAKAVDVDFDTYAAVAYSQSTGKYGYVWNYRSRASAEKAALAKCPHSDAKIIGWVKGGWLAVAIGDGKAYGVAWEYGEGASNAVAKARAIEECKKRDQKVETLICLCSGNHPPEVVERTISNH